MDHDKRENLDGYMTELAVAETDNETDTLMKLILANVASGVTAVELDGDKVEYLFANDKFCSMLGYTKEQYQKEVKDTYSLFHPDDRGRIYELVHLLQPGDNPLTLEYRMLCRDGSYKKIRMVIVSTEFGHEKKVLQLSVFEDITEEYKAKELQEELLDNLPCGAGTFELKDNELKVLYLNQKYWELVGRKPESSKTQSVSDVILPEDRGVVRHTIRRVFESNQEQECEVHILHEDGHYIPFVVRASIVVHKSGKRTMYVTYTPITENAVTFRRMLPSVLDNMMASSMDYCFVKDRGLHYVCASKTFAELVGYDDAKDIIGKTDFDLFPQDIAEKIRLEDMKVLESGEAIRNSVERLPLRSKEIRYSNKSKYLLRDSSGFVIGIYATARDITEDKEVYSRLKTLTDTIPGGLATYEMKGDKIYSRYISEGVMNLVGYSENREELLRKDPRELIAKDDIDGMQKQISRMVNEHIPIDYTFRAIKSTDDYCWINFRGNEVERKEDSIIVNAVMLDVTEQVTARLKIDEMEQQNRNKYTHEMKLRKGMIKNAVFYYQLNLTTEIVEEYESQNNEIPFMKKGMKMSENVKQCIKDHILPSDLERVKKTLFIDGLQEAYKSGKKEESLIYRRMLSDGNYHWMRMEIFFMEKPDNGEAIAFLIGKDIDKEWKNHLSVSTILDEDIESIFHVDVQNGVATIAHMLEKVNYVKVYNHFQFDDVSKKAGEDLVLEEDRNVFLNFYNIAKLQKQLKKDKIVTATYRVKEPTGTYRKLSKAYYLDELEDVIVVTRRDITKLDEEEQRQKQKLKGAVDKANQANQAKSDFLSNMSHDIRTPLNAVLAFSNPELLEGANETKLREYLSKVNMSGEYLLGIINDVLDMSRIEQDKIVLTPEPYSYIEFERTIRNVIDELSRKRNIEFVIDTSQVGAPEIYVDHVRFNQIFINLLSNAVKFTNKGGKVELIIQELNSEKNGERIKRFIVRDNGIGMSEDFVPHAFESFNQEYRKDTSERNLGTGLGLSIVEKLVDMMGGTIKLESKMNQGTTFTVDFPYDLHKVTDDVKHHETKTYDYSRLRGIRILLAEDNDINTEIAIALLEKYGSIVERSENGEEAYLKYKASEKNYFQLILMDIRMPVMDGLTATKKIRALRRTDAKTIPIIAMTADAFNEDEKTAYKAGMNAHVAKPINPTQLYEVCLNYI